ncbi:effector binding domain-containing protein [Candidatus Dependentiae bacterium]|nr:effector binding domain-containing protein [Candidatus Dependentiae bacterium]
MENNVTTLPEITVVGIKARTNNSLEANPSTALIGQTLQRYFQDNISQKIQDRVHPGTLFGIYTEYETDLTGDYTYFVGEEVSSTDSIPVGLEVLHIPLQRYMKYTTNPGAMPTVVIDAWHKIWQMTTQELGGERCYHSDFEVYDTRSLDPQNTVLDIYIGIKP